jgi:hypothetical protein
MTDTRSIEDKLLQAPIEVVLGGSKYPVKLLCLRDAALWRKKLWQTLAQVPSYAGGKADFATTMKGMVVDAPDQVVDLFFAYAKDLDRTRIEQEANEAELSVAWKAVMEVALPLSGSLTGAMTRAAAT